MKTVFFGASHAFMMAQGLGTFSAKWEDVVDGPLPIADAGGECVGYLMLSSPRSELFDISAAGVRIAARHATRLAALDSPDNRCFLLIGGNEHNSLFMCTHDVPFDFHDDRHPDRIRHDRQIVPGATIRARLKTSLQPVAVLLRTAGAGLPAMRKYVVAPPPPIPSDEHIKGLPEAFDFERRTLEDPWIRLKVYRLYIEELAQVCAALGLELLLPPAHCVDEDGFLAEPFWSHSTHAKPSYYRPFIDLPLAA